MYNWDVITMLSYLKSDQGPGSVEWCALVYKGMLETLEVGDGLVMHGSVKSKVPRQMQLGWVQVAGQLGLNCLPVSRCRCAQVLKQLSARPRGPLFTMHLQKSQLSL